MRKGRKKGVVKVRRYALTLALSAVLVVAPGYLLASSFDGSAGIRYESGFAGSRFGSSVHTDSVAGGYARAHFERLYTEGVSGFLDVEFVRDLDGSEPGDPMTGIVDTYGSRDYFRVNYGYLDFSETGGSLSFRLGRQRVHSAESVYFDGAKVEYSGDRLSGFAFGGLRASHYIEPERDGVIGGGLTFHPSRDVIVYLKDVKYVENSLEIGGAATLYGSIHVSGSFSAINADPRYLKATASGFHVVGFGVSLEYTRKLGSGVGYDDFDFDYTSPDGRSLERLRIGDLKPYAEYTVRVKRSLFEGAFASVGFTRHKLVHDADEDEYNRTYNGFFASLELRGLFSRGIDFSASYEHVEEERVVGDDGSNTSLFIAVEKEIHPYLRLGGGCFLSSYSHVYEGEDFSSPIDEKSKNYYAFLQYSPGPYTAKVEFDASSDDVTAVSGSRWIKRIYLSIEYRFL